MSSSDTPRGTRSRTGCLVALIVLPLGMLAAITAADIFVGYDAQKKIDAAFAVAVEVPLSPGADKVTWVATTRLHLDIPAGPYRLYGRLPEHYTGRARLDLEPALAEPIPFGMKPVRATLQGGYHDMRTDWLSDVFDVPRGAGKNLAILQLTVSSSNGDVPERLYVGVSSVGDLADYAGVER